MATLELQALPVSLATATGRMDGAIVLMVAPLLSYALATGEMSGRAVNLSASPRSYAIASGQLSGNTSLVSARPGSYVTSSAVMSGRTLPLEARPISRLSASGALGGTAKLLAGRMTSYVSASGALSGGSELRGRTICDLIKESLSLWGFLCSKNAPAYALERAVTDVNTALQLVWNNAEGHDYWSNETLTIVLADGEDSFTLADDVQNVVGPCRRSDNNRPLAPVRTTGELETFADIYLNGESAGEPLAYHVDRSKQSADDPAKCVLRVSPAVSGASVSLRLDVVKECPRYTTGDLNACPLVPIPHQYTETLLVPIIRYQACSFYLFTPMDGAQKETIEREYQQARISLGLADPNPVKTSVAKEVSK